MDLPKALGNGLGKTLRIVSLINSQNLSNILIISQASMVIPWKRDLEAWLIRPLSIGVATSKVWRATDIVISTFLAARKHADKISASRWDLIVYNTISRNPIPKIADTVKKQQLKVARLPWSAPPTHIEDMCPLERHLARHSDCSGCAEATLRGGHGIPKTDPWCGGHPTRRCRPSM